MPKEMSWGLGGHCRRPGWPLTSQFPSLEPEALKVYSAWSRFHSHGTRVDGADQRPGVEVWVRTRNSQCSGDLGRRGAEKG